MDNKELNNIESASSRLQNYEIEVSDKKNFFRALLDKLKSNKNQKLLNSGNRTKTTNQSISSLWGFGNFRSSLFNTLDNMRKAIFDRFYSEPPKNTLAVEIISENLQKENEITKEPEEPLVTPIIPVTQQQKNNNMKNEMKTTIEVTNIDTSAIDEKNIDKESIDDKINDVLEKDESSIDSENIQNKTFELNKTENSLDER